MARRSKDAAPSSYRGRKRVKLSADRSRIRPRIKFWLEANGDSVLCRGVREILRGVEETGSIKDAAALVGRSYRFIWRRLKETEAALGARLVATQVGGAGTQRSELTALGRRLVALFDDVNRQMARLIDQDLSQQLDDAMAEAQAEEAAESGRHD